jgi:hypothetical protein
MKLIVPIVVDAVPLVSGEQFVLFARGVAQSLVKEQGHIVRGTAGSSDVES